jgi:hypothetical protein
VTGRDWKQIEAELDDLKPGGSDKDCQTPEQPLQPTVGGMNEEVILKHIANALRMDCTDVLD